MSQIDKKAEKVLNSWIELLIPESLSVKELEELADKSQLSFELLKKLKYRTHKNISSDSLIKIALATGFSLEELSATFSHPNKTSKVELDWIKFGKSLTEEKKKDFLEFIMYTKDKWNL